MLKTRVIPCLLLRGAGLVKTICFKEPKYVGDPINAIKIFNDKEVDELVLLDISASREGRGPAYSVIEEVASECFMPLAYGGGIRTVDEARRILKLGVEKAVFNTTAWREPAVLAAASSRVRCPGGSGVNRCSPQDCSGVTRSSLRGGTRDRC